MKDWGRIARGDLLMQPFLGWRQLRLRRVAHMLCCLAIGWNVISGPVRAADVVTLKNGMTLEGVFGSLGSLGPDALAPTGAGEIKLKRIVLCDDQLRRTFVFSGNRATEFAPSPITSISSCRSMKPRSAWRTTAWSSTISTRIFIER